MLPRPSRLLVPALALVLLAGVGANGSATGALPAAPASAPTALAPSTPILLSDADASRPGVAVAEDGTVHLGWVEEPDSGPVFVYCRMPRGATACETEQRFERPGDFAFGPVDLILRDGDVVQLLGYIEGVGSLLYESLDGGDTFLAPRAIGSIQTGFSVAGPGLNSVLAAYSGSAAPPGAGVQVQPTDGGFAGQYVELNDGFQRWYSGGAGLLDEQTPISAYTDLQDTFLRSYDPTAGGDYNNPDNWLPSQTLPDENEPTIVTSAGGSTYLMTHVEYGSAIRDAYQVRKVSAVDGSVSAPFLATDIGPALFGTMTADASGGLTAVWTSAGDLVDIRSSYSVGGGSFTPPGTLVERVRAFNLRVRTAGDGGGFVVWDDNGNGSVYGAAIPAGGVEPDPDAPPPPPNVGGFTPPGNTAKCQRTVTIKPGVVAAAQGGPCFDETSPGVWTTTSDVNINGIRFVGGKSSTRVTVNTVSHKVTATDGVVQKAGPIVLAKDAGTWDIDGATEFSGLERFGIKLFDFKALGIASVRFASGKAEVTLNLGLPSPFDVVSGQTVLTTTMLKGLDLTKITIRAPQLTVGEFGFKDLVVTYDRSSSEFNGEVKLKLPPTGAFVDVKIGFRSGRLVKLALTYKDGAPFPFAIYPGLWVKGVGFLYDGTDGFAIGGGADLAVPTPEGPITIDAIGSPPGTGGGFRFAVPQAGPASLDLQGTLRLFGFALANTKAHFDTTGLFNFRTTVDIGFPRLGVNGSVGGEVNLAAGTFYADAAVEICVIFCANGKGVISDVGIAICGEIEFGIDPFSFTLGFLVGYKWQTGLEVGTTCDTGPYKTPASGTAPSPSEAVVSPDGTLFLPGASDPTSYAVNVPGEGGVPTVVVRDVNGNIVVQSDPAKPLEPQQGGDVVLVPSPSTDSVRLVVIQRSGSPVAYRITASGGSRLDRRVARAADGSPTAVPAITVAESFDPTVVTATVGGAATSRKRTLTYTSSNLGESGRSVRFVETSAAGINHVIGTSDDPSGSLPFTTFDGVAGRRSIEAVVLNSDGLPISTTTVASFTAPGYVLPTKPTRLKLAVDAKSRLTVTWAGSRAQRWLVFAVVADGRRVQLSTTGRKVVLPAVGRREKVRITVRGVDRLGREGPAASAKRP